MRIVSFEATKYRSIKKTNKLTISNYCVLIGPNNEGKSNLLNGLVTALNLVSAGNYSVGRIRSRASNNYFYGGDNYVWDRDIPVAYKEKRETKTVFILGFEMTTAERKDFKRELGSNLKNSLALKLELGWKESSFDIIIKGRAKTALSAKKDQIANFIKKRLDYQYIPCVRTVDLSEGVLNDMLAREFKKLAATAEYSQCLEQMRKLEEPMITELEKLVTDTVAEFIPDVKKIKLSNSEAFSRSIRRNKIMVDDGTDTELEAKGDGVKSLVAVGLMRHLASTASGERDLILCIEEPEAHLHPKAIHGIKRVLLEAALKCQIIISTHSPILIDRNDLANNIIVEKHSARHCSNIKEIRDVIGVHVADNLVAAELVILVEGESDQLILSSILKDKVKGFAEKMASGNVIIIAMTGCSKATYCATFYKNLLCDVYLVVDSDDAGLQAVKAVTKAKILDMNEISMITSKDRKKSEIEDVLKVECYQQRFFETFGVDLPSTGFRKSKAEWSCRIEKIFHDIGKPWDKNIEEQAKALVAECASAMGFACVDVNKAESISHLIDTIRNRLSRIK